LICNNMIISRKGRGRHKMADKKFPKDAMRVLKETSRTFYIPITFLEKELKHSVACAYLVMRAIDEIEDHEEIVNDLKHSMLMQISELLKAPVDEERYLEFINHAKDKLHEITVRFGDLMAACSDQTRTIVIASSSEMAYGIAK